MFPQSGTESFGCYCMYKMRAKWFMPVTYINKVGGVGVMGGVGVR